MEDGHLGPSNKRLTSGLIKDMMIWENDLKLFLIWNNGNVKR